MRLRACFERAADAGIISYEHCGDICGCLTEYESGAISMDVSDLSDDAREALDAVILWLDGAPE